MQSPAARRGFFLPPLGDQGEVAHASVPEGIRIGGDRGLTTPQSAFGCQLPFTGEPFVHAFAENFPLVFSLQLGKIAVK